MTQKTDLIRFFEEGTIEVGYDGNWNVETQEVIVNTEKSEMRQLIQRVLDHSSEEKRKNVVLLIEVAVEVILRCPYLADIPVEEQEELLKILREKDIL